MRWRNRKESANVDYRRHDRGMQGAAPSLGAILFFLPELHDRGRYVMRARIEADGQLPFISIRQSPSFNGAAGRPVEILVLRVGGALPVNTSAPIPDVSLTDTYWKLTELDGQRAALGAGQRELHMVLTSEGGRVHGFSGCDRFLGSYALHENELSFKPLASTRMACIDGMEQEQRFLKALGEVVRFTVSGDSLALYTGDERLLLCFQAIALH